MTDLPLRAVWYRRRAPLIVPTRQVFPVRPPNQCLPGLCAATHLWNLRSSIRVDWNYTFYLYGEVHSLGVRSRHVCHLTELSFPAFRWRSPRLN